MDVSEAKDKSAGLYGDVVDVLPKQETKEEAEPSVEDEAKVKRKIPQGRRRKGGFERMLKRLVEKGAYKERIEFYPRMKLRQPTPAPAPAPAPATAPPK